MCSRGSVIRTGVSPSTSVFPCQYHSTIAPYSSIHLPPTLYNVFRLAIQFYSVPPLTHTSPQLNTTLIRRKSGWRLTTFQQSKGVNPGSNGQRRAFNCIKCYYSCKCLLYVENYNTACKITLWHWRHMRVAEATSSYSRLLSDPAAVRGHFCVYTGVSGLRAAVPPRHHPDLAPSHHQWTSWITL